MAIWRDKRDASTHVPVQKRLSGDFGSPIEVMASNDLDPEHKCRILEVWQEDLKAQPDSLEKRDVCEAIKDALASLDATAERH